MEAPDEDRTDALVCRLYCIGHSEGGAMPDPRANHLLAALPAGEYERLLPRLQPVQLPRPTELEAANEPIEYVYFPTSGIASIVSIDASGETVDTAMIGREGMTGLAVFLGTRQSPMRT